MITEAMLKSLRLLIKPLKTKIANSIASAVIENVDDSKKIQLLQLGVLDGETVDDCQRFQEFGFTSVPLDGAEAVVIFPNGDRANPFVVGVEDRRHRPTDWDSGEAGIYNAFGVTVRLKADGTAFFEATSVKLGSDSAVDSAVKGNTYRTAEDTMLSLVSAAIALIGAPLPLTAPQVAIVTAATVGITTFQAAAASYLATKVKVE